jgi:hypothetical protein
VPHDSTAALLKKLGADDAKSGKPVGACVLGRGGLEVDIQLSKEKEAKDKQKSN